MTETDNDHPSDSYQSIDSCHSNDSDQSSKDSNSSSIGAKDQLEFDDQPIFHSATSFITFVGTKARMHCSPTYMEFPLVSMPAKVHLEYCSEEEKIKRQHGREVRNFVELLHIW